MNYKLIIAYKGTNYAGFAKQNNQITIEQTIINVIKELFNCEIKLFASGRTDKYVHAAHQVINIKHQQLNYNAATIMQALNARLPLDIRVLDCEIVDDQFHARFCAKSKTYLYKLNLSVNYNLFENEIVYQYNAPIDYTKLDKYINVVLGKHNFLSFSTSELDDTVRTIYEIKYEIQNDILNIYVTGNGFLRNMVRILIGVFLNYNENKITLDEIKNLLNQPKKGAGIRKAPGGGLYLWKVTY